MTTTTSRPVAPASAQERTAAPGGAAPRAASVDLDEVQRRVVDHPLDGGNLLVVGAPGSGKSTTAMALLERRLAAARTSTEVLMLVPGRRAAARVREQATSRLGRTVGEVLVRTPASISFSILRRRASLLGQPPPTLITGPEQDAILAELLAGHAAGVGAVPEWTERVPPGARGTRAFRHELRDLLMRAAEAGLSPAGLAALGRRRRRPEWVAAAGVMREYEQVLHLGQLTPDRGERYDSALIVDEAVAALRAWPSDIRGSEPPGFGTVLVDDLQDVTLATARLLRTFADAGAQVVLFGDADVAAQGFRGGAAALVGAATAGREQPGGFDARKVVLPSVWRQSAELRRATQAVTEQLAATGGAAHRAAPGRGPGVDAESTGSAAPPRGVRACVVRTRSEEAALIARHVREEHLHHATSYADMAVVVRGGPQAAALRRRLAGAGVPVTGPGAEAALRDAPAVRPLLLALDHCQGRRASAADVVALLSSPLMGAERMDTVSLRALRRALRSAAGAAGESTAVDDLVVDAVGDAERRAVVPERLRQGPARLARILEAGARAAAAAGATTETVLWALWAEADLAEAWRRAALAGGPAGERADRDLDAVLELFRAAEQFTERNPAAPPAQFVRFVEQQDLPADSLAARSGPRDAVQVLTAAGAVGGEWAFVTVAGVQEDVWPDMRLRDSLLGAQELAETAAGRRGPGATEPRQARQEVLADELRAFAVAVSRARRRLLLTAVRDTETCPSAFLDLVDPDTGADGPRVAEPVRPPLDLRGLVAELRAELPDGPDAGPSAALLAQLAREGVPGADPASWPHALPESCSEPLWGPDDMVELSPSSLETAQACSLRWALERAGGRRAPGAEQTLGTLVHAIASDHPHGTREELMSELDRRWPGLGLGEGWAARRQRAIAEAMIERLAGYLALRPGKVDVEREIEATIGRALLRGRVDRVEHLDDGRVRIVDLKTGGQAKSAADVGSDPQLGAYQAAVRAGALGDGVEPGGGALVYVGLNKEAAQRHQSALADDWAEQMLGKVAAGAASASFAATEGDACRTCPVRTSCPARPEGARVHP